MMMGAALHRLAEVPAGGVCAILGFGTAVLKSATLSSSAFARPMRGMFFQAAPIVRVAVEPVRERIPFASSLFLRITFSAGWRSNARRHGRC